MYNKKIRGIKNGVITREVKEVIIHPLYKSLKDEDRPYDVAILKFIDVPFNGRVYPACLPRTGVTFAGQRATGIVYVYCVGCKTTIVRRLSMSEKKEKKPPESILTFTFSQKLRIQCSIKWRHESLKPNRYNS